MLLLLLIYGQSRTSEVVPGNQGRKHNAPSRLFHREMDCPVQWSFAIPSAFESQSRANQGSVVANPFCECARWRKAGHSQVPVAVGRRLTCVLKEAPSFKYRLFRASPHPFAKPPPFTGMLIIDSGTKEGCRNPWGHKVPWKIGMLIRHPVTSRPLTHFPEERSSFISLELGSRLPGTRPEFLDFPENQ